MKDDDGYGRLCEYRVFSERDDEPLQPNAGRRLLHVRMVWYHGSAIDHPTYYDVMGIEPFPTKAEGKDVSELILNLERMLGAVNKPVLILAEWEFYLEQQAMKKAKQENQAGPENDEEY
jgi:hypothetical protein